MPSHTKSSIFYKLFSVFKTNLFTNLLHQTADLQQNQNTNRDMRSIASPADEANEQPQWPDELDALIASPQHHKLLFENEFVRVLDTNIAPGEITNVHTHKYPASLYFLSWSHFIRYDAEGNVLLDSRMMENTPAIGSAMWSNPLPAHALKNIGANDLHVFSVEVKQSAK